MTESEEYYRFILTFDNKEREITLDGKRAEVIVKFLGLRWPTTYARRENMLCTLLLEKPMGSE